MKLPFTGGCLCGAVRYECSSEPVRQAHCFCTDCQKAGGTQMSTNVIVPKDSLRVTKGKPAQYVGTGDSGKKIIRFFCSGCGSPLWSEPELIAELRIVKAGSLDDSSWVKPETAIYLDSAPPWSAIPQGVTTFAKARPR